MFDLIWFDLICDYIQDSVESMQSIDSCEYIWEAGVGFAQSPPLNYIHDLNRWVGRRHPYRKTSLFFFLRGTDVFSLFAL